IAVVKNGNFSIQPRLAHTATLTSDNNEIIIIGGNSNYNYNLTTATPVFVSLNITTEPYEYSKLITTGDSPPSLAVHTVNLYQNYMIVAFGNITNSATPPTEINSRIYLLDMPCKVWVTTFTPGKSICSIPSNVTSSESSNGPSSGSSNGPSNGPSSGLNIGVIIFVTIFFSI
ncbi:3675_t:CDS:2, partial [Scutellospora calospora]